MDLCPKLHCSIITQPVIAPVWADLDFRGMGRIYYRATQDPATLELVTSMITDVNPGLMGYEPTLAVIVTWFDATHISKTVCS